MPGSFRKQDAAAPTAERAVQVRPPGSILKVLRVERVGLGEVAELASTNHYLHSVPAAASVAYGVFFSRELVGAVIITPGGRNAYRVLAAARPQDVATLARLWLADEIPSNAESRVLGVVLRDLRREGTFKAVLSYADPGAGHRGIVYKASGWRNLGFTADERYVVLADGRHHNSRSVSSKYGSNDLAHLRRTGISAARVVVPGKNRFLYVLDPAWRWRVRERSKDGPRRSAPRPSTGT